MNLESCCGNECRIKKQQHNYTKLVCVHVFTHRQPQQQKWCKTCSPFLYFLWFQLRLTSIGNFKSLFTVQLVVFMWKFQHCYFLWFYFKFCKMIERVYQSDFWTVVVFSFIMSGLLLFVIFVSKLNILEVFAFYVAIIFDGWFCVECLCSVCLFCLFVFYLY